jgi:jumonji domain-containing protein 2
MDGSAAHQGHGGASASASASLTAVQTTITDAERHTGHFYGPSAFATEVAHRQLACAENSVETDVARDADTTVSRDAPQSEAEAEGEAALAAEADTVKESSADPEPTFDTTLSSPGLKKTGVEPAREETLETPRLVSTSNGDMGNGQSPVTVTANTPAAPRRDDQHSATPALVALPPSPQTPVIYSSNPGGCRGPSSDIEFDHDVVEDHHRTLRLKPTLEQWRDFPAVLAFARSLGADGDGCFKVIIPNELQAALPEKHEQSLPAHAYKVKLIRRTSFWQVSTVPSQGVFASPPPEGPGDFSEPVGAALKSLKQLFRKQQNRQLRNIRYRVDVPAWTENQRRLAGVPETSPIYPLKGDKLDKTKAVIPGIHTPYVYESASSFGATFQIHAEDFRLASLNHLYKGRKIWIVVPATDVDVAERALGRGSGCSQFMRHRAEFFFPDKLEKLGIPYRVVDQRPGETIVILPDAYHEGFSCGYTIAEAKNYADDAWTTDSYQPCQASCRLATAIPAAFMRPLQEGEQRLDLCAAYGDGLSVPAVQVPAKREHERDMAGPLPDQEAKRAKLCE